MPKYVYACNNLDCMKQYEVSHSIHDQGPTTCPNCREESLVKIPAESNIMSPPEDDFSMRRPKSRQVGAMTEEYIQTVKEEKARMKDELRRDMMKKFRIPGR